MQDIVRVSRLAFTRSHERMGGPSWVATAYVVCASVCLYSGPVKGRSIARMHKAVMMVFLLKPRVSMH